MIFFFLNVYSLKPARQTNTGEKLEFINTSYVAWNGFRIFW